MLCFFSPDRIRLFIVFLFVAMMPTTSWAVLQGFDKDYYLATKLSALQTSDSTWIDKTVIDLEAALLSYGFTAESHYMTYGYLEGLSPNQWFNASEYISFKAEAMVNNGQFSTTDEANDSFRFAWPYDPYLHYIQYGAAEGINPSNNFDESLYLTDKLIQLQSISDDWNNKSIDDLRQTFSALGMTIMDHYMNYGVNEGLSPKEVPEDEKVSVSTPTALDTAKASVNTVEDVLNWSRNNLYYNNTDPFDPAPDVEEVIQNGYGDCKMIAGAISVLLDDVGQSNSIVSVIVNSNGATFMHMYVVYNQNDVWYVIDNGSLFSNTYSSLEDTYSFLSESGRIFLEKLQVSGSYDEFKTWYNGTYFPNN